MLRSSSARSWLELLSIVLSYTIDHSALLMVNISTSGAAIPGFSAYDTALLCCIPPLLLWAHSSPLGILKAASGQVMPLKETMQ